MERDPFDLPAVMVNEKSASPSGLRQTMSTFGRIAGFVRWRKEYFPLERRDDMRRRLLKLVVGGILVCATLQLYELHEMSNTQLNGISAPFAKPSAVLQSSVGATQGQTEAVNRPPVAAGSETKPADQTVAQPATSPLDGEASGNASHERNGAAVHSTSGGRVARVTRQPATTRRPLRSSRGASLRQGQRYNARAFRQSRATVAYRANARDMNYQTQNRKRSGSSTERRKHGKRRFLIFDTRQ